MEMLKMFLLLPQPKGNAWFHQLYHSVFSSYLLMKHITSPIMGWLLNFNPKWKDFAMGNFFYWAIIAHRLYFTPQPNRSKTFYAFQSCHHPRAFFWVLEDLKKQILKFFNEPFQREVTLKFLGYRTQEATLGALWQATFLYKSASYQPPGCTQGARLVIPTPVGWPWGA